MKKQNKIYSISTGAFGYDDIHIKPEDIVIVWLDNHGFTHVFYCIINEDIQNAINLVKKNTRDFNSIKYVIVNNLDVKYKYDDVNVLPSTPDTIVLPNDVLADIYNDMKADYWIEQEKSGLLDVE